MAEIALFLLVLLGVVLAFLALVWMAWWSLFADRARGRARCPRCWYDMSASPTTTCGECGHTVRDEQQLYATRRRWRPAVLAMLGCAVGIAATYAHFDSRGWLSLVPSRLLIAAMPWMDHTRDGGWNEVCRRASFGELSRQQWAALLERCAAGDSAVPPSNRWIERYGMILSQYLGRLEADAPAGAESELEKILHAIPPRVDLATRPAWPVNITPHVSIRVRDWWPVGSQVRVTARPQYEGAEELVRHRAGARRVVAPCSLPLPGLPQGVTQVPIEFTFERRLPGVSDEWQLMTTMRETVTIRRGVPAPVDQRTRAVTSPPAGGAPVDDTISRQDGRRPASSSDPHARVETARGVGPDGVPVFEPVHDPELDELIRRVFARGLVKWNEGASPLRFGYTPHLTFDPRLADTVFGLRLELLHNDVLARRLDLWWRGGRPDMWRGADIMYEDLDLLRGYGPDDEGWVLRITGERDVAARAIGGTRYWAGTVEIADPPAEVYNSIAPEPEWWIKDTAAHSAPLR